MWNDIFQKLPYNLKANHGIDDLYGVRALQQWFVDMARRISISLGTMKLWELLGTQAYKFLLSPAKRLICSSGAALCSP